MVIVCYPFSFLLPHLLHHSLLPLCCCPAVLCSVMLGVACGHLCATTQPDTIIVIRRKKTWFPDCQFAGGVSVWLVLDKCRAQCWSVGIHCGVQHCAVTLRGRGRRKDENGKFELLNVGWAKRPKYSHHEVHYGLHGVPERCSAAKSEYSCHWKASRLQTETKKTREPEMCCATRPKNSGCVISRWTKDRDQERLSGRAQQGLMRQNVN